MELNPLKVPVSSLAAPLGIVIFCAFVAASVSMYPDGFSPLDNWISDLGNTNLNPEGAAIFNTGCMLTAVPLIAFYLGLYRWYGIERWRNLMLGVAQLAGVISGAALAMVGYYPETFATEHFLWAGIFFVTTFLALLLANAALLMHLRYNKWTAAVGLVAVAVQAVFIAGMAASVGIPAFEWASVALGLAWMAAMAINTYVSFI
ncbi:MAG: hypothetical protein A4E28_02900 [Methanocella sp. PtaU1.Bin125]|nr:MAG: hypothetical protein A4E28_02900 [Methanocella sp. PtaU1.Bin125]